MNYHLRFNVEISFQLSNDMFKLLTEYIKNSSELKHHAEHGGFWYGNTNSRKFIKTKKEKESCWLRATTRQIDTVLLKACEMYANYSENDKASELYANLYTILKNAVDLSNSMCIHMGVVEVNNGKTKLK